MLLRDREQVVGVLDNEPEALMREARRRTRRRRAFLALALSTLVGFLVAGFFLIDSGANAPAGAGADGAASLPVGRFAALGTAGPLAVAPGGALYVADVSGHRVLVRLPNGRFRVIAGDGRDGFSGDGGPATRAELSTITDIAVSPGGDLYIADGGRIRVLANSGIIRTVAGDGRPIADITPRTPPLRAGLGSPSSPSYEEPMIAFSPHGQLFISTGYQVLRFTSRDTLMPVPAEVTSGPQVLRGKLRGFGPLAIDDSGNIDVAGFNGWSIWQITRNGAAHEIGPGSGARQSGGDLSLLQRGPDGRVYAEDGPELLQIDGRQLKPVHSLGASFWLTYFAFSPNGSLYADEIPGNGGFEARQQLIRFQHGHKTVLWEQPSRARR